MVENIEVIISTKNRGVRGESASVFPVGVINENGEEIAAVAKVYENKEAASKEEQILHRLEEKEISLVARIIASLGKNINHTDEDQSGVTLIESRINGDPVALINDPIPLVEVRKKSFSLFEQLSKVSNDDELIDLDIAFCGDISPANILDTPRGYVIADWSGRFGLFGGAELTEGFIAPEVLDRDQELSYVEADTYSLGCLLARLLVGKNRFDQIVTKKISSENSYLRYEDLEGILPEESKDFFKIVLSHKPNERVLEGVKEPGEHYHRLAELFRASF